MIKVFYDGYGFYRRLHSNCVGTPAIEPLHGDDYSLFDHDIETLNMIGRVTIKALLDIKLEKTIVVLTDKDGNPAPMRIDKSRDDRVFEHENGNALKLTFDELAPLDDVLTTEKTLSVSKEKTYLHTIGALLEYINGDITGVKKPPSFASEADMIATIEAHYKNNHKQGLKARKLQENFALAKAKLNES